MRRHRPGSGDRKEAVERLAADRVRLTLPIAICHSNVTPCRKLSLIRGTSLLATKLGGDGKGGGDANLTIGAWTPTGNAVLPDWAQWFLDLGAGLAGGRESLKQWVIVTVPDRRFAASLAATGATASLMASRQSPPTSETIGSMESGQPITWLDADNNLASGVFEGVVDDMVRYVKRTHGGWERPARKRPVDRCESFCAMVDGEEPFAGSKELVTNLPFVLAALPAQPLDQLARAASDTIVCGVRSRLEEELSAHAFSAGGVSGALLDLLRPAGLLPTGQRHWSVIVPSGNHPEPVETKRGLAVFDGPSAYLRWRDSIDAPSNLVIIDRWDPRSGDIASIARADRMQSWINEPTAGIPAVPEGVECFSWVEAR